MTTIIESGDKVHIITRRLFELDLRRHFVGVVGNVSNGTAKVKGYVFVFDEWANQFIRHSEERVRLFSLIDANLIINILPPPTVITDLKYIITGKGQRVITDGSSFILDVSEFWAKK